jgi:transposase
MPELLADKVEAGPHAARFFLYLAETLKLNLYKVFYMGTPPYNRATLVAVIFYAMYTGYFESQNIVKFATDSIGAQWILNGMKMPSYKTVERTITYLLKELDSVYEQILNICEEQGLIGGKRVYTDGLKIQANASKHKAMSYEYLGKKIAHGKEDLKKLFGALKEIASEWELPENAFYETAMADAEDVHKKLRKIHQDELRQKQEQIFNTDFDETAGRSEPQTKETGEERLIDEIKSGLRVLESVEPEKQDEATDILNNIGFVSGRVSRMEEAKSELEVRWKAAHGNKKIPDTQQINFTDPDSCIMVTKHHGVQQCYNNFAVVDDKANIILGCYTSNNSVDQVSLKPCVERTEQTYGSLEGFQFGADAGFFSAGNISYMKGKGIDFYASYPEAKSPFAKDKFKYNENTDTYTCPEGFILTPNGSSDGKTCEYSNEAACCIKCKCHSDCTKAWDGVRRIVRDMEGDKLREECREKSDSAVGREILRLRKSIPEPVWGNIKTQDGFIQMHYRGIEKASCEFELHCLLQNIRKLMKSYFRSKSYQDIVHSKCGGCCKVA